MHRRTAAAVCCLALGLPALAAGPAPKTYTAVGQPTLKLTVPAGWQDHSRPNPPGKTGPVAVQLDAKEDNGLFSVQLFFVKPPNRPGMFDDETLKKLVNAAAKPYVETASDKTVTLQDLDGGATHGYYATLADTRDPKGKFTHVTVVNVRLGDGLLAATIRHQAESPDLPQAIEMIKDATLNTPATRPAATRPAATPRPTRVRPAPAAGRSSTPRPGA